MTILLQELQQTQQSSKTWAENLGRIFGQKIWAENLGRIFGQKIWAENLGRKSVRESNFWAENLI